MNFNSLDKVDGFGSSEFYKSKDSITTLKYLINNNNTPKNSNNFYKAHSPDKPKSTLPPIVFTPPVPEDYDELPPTQIFIRPLYEHDKTQNSTIIVKTLPSAKTKTASPTNYDSHPHRPHPPRVVSTTSVHEDDDPLPLTQILKVKEGGYGARASKNVTKRKSSPQPAVSIDNLLVTHNFFSKEDALAQQPMDWKSIISGKYNEDSDVSQDSFDDLFILQPQKVLKETTKKAMINTVSPKVNGDTSVVQRRKSISTDQKQSLKRSTHRQKSMLTKEPMPVQRESTIQTEAMSDKSLKGKNIKKQAATGNNGNQDSFDDSMIPFKKFKTSKEKKEKKLKTPKVPKVGSNNRITTRRKLQFSEVFIENKVQRKSTKVKIKRSLINEDTSDESDTSGCDFKTIKTPKEPVVGLSIGVTTRRMSMFAKEVEENKVSMISKSNKPQANDWPRVFIRRPSMLAENSMEKKLMTSKERAPCGTTRLSMFAGYPEENKLMTRKERGPSVTTRRKSMFADKNKEAKRTTIENNCSCIVTRRSSMSVEEYRKNNIGKTLKIKSGKTSGTTRRSTFTGHPEEKKPMTPMKPGPSVTTRRMSMLAEKNKQENRTTIKNDCPCIVTRRSSMSVEEYIKKKIGKTLKIKSGKTSGNTRRSTFTGHPEEKKATTPKEPGPFVTTRRMSMLAEKNKQDKRRTIENDCPCIVTRRSSMSVEKYTKNNIGKTLKIKSDKTDIIGKYKATKCNDDQDSDDDSRTSKKFNTPTEELKSSQVFYGTRLEKKMPKLIKAKPVKTLKSQSLNTKKIEENTEDATRKQTYQNKCKEHSREIDYIKKRVPNTMMENSLPNDKRWRSKQNVLEAMVGVIDKNKSILQGKNDNTIANDMSETDSFHKQNSVVNGSANGATCSLTENEPLSNMTLKSSKDMYVLHNKSFDSESSSVSGAFNLIISKVWNLKIAMTMCPESYRNLLQRLSGSLWFLTNDAKECDVLVAGNGHLSYKIIIAIARGVPIVNLGWVDQVIKTESTLFPYDLYIFDDSYFQERHQFNMKKSLHLARTRSLFDGIVFMLSSRLPTLNILKDIIVCAGGIVTDCIPRPKVGQQIYFVTSMIDRQEWNICRKMNANIKCLTKDCVVTSVIQQCASVLRSFILK